MTLPPLTPMDAAMDYGLSLVPGAAFLALYSAYPRGLTKQQIKDAIEAVAWEAPTDASLATALVRVRRGVKGKGWRLCCKPGVGYALERAG